MEVYPMKEVVIPFFPSPDYWTSCHLPNRHQLTFAIGQ